MVHTILDTPTYQDAAVRTLTEYAATTPPERLEFLIPPLGNKQLPTATGLTDAIRRLHDERLAVVEKQGYGTKPPNIKALNCELRWCDATRGSWILVTM